MIVKKLYTIGDSWTYGWGLPGPHIPGRNKEHAWPTLLSQEFNCELINEAWGGAPNEWMFRKTVEWVCNQDNLDDVIVIVGWVEPNRREEVLGIPHVHGFISPHEPKEYKPFLEYHNDELAHYKSICYMVALQEFLKSKNIKYLFYQPWYDLLGIVDAPKTLISFSFPVDGIKNIIEKIDQKYCIGPVNGFTSSKEWMNFILQREGTLFGNIYETLTGNVGKWRADHPNIEHHEIMYEVIKEKLLEIYDV
ncbi:hypothetical protein HN615_12125 [Candidatus Woesearchaeota archaeon]|jgi:hypothetical protein|nr:hypothetical protein [Candidatus Woesearchaeota archaeon]